MKISGNKNTFKIWMTVIIVIVVVCCFVLLFEFIKISNLKSKSRDLKKSYENLQQQYADLDSQLNYVGDPDNPYSNYNNYLEDYAREVLNWGKDGHKYFMEK